MLQYLALTTWLLLVAKVECLPPLPVPLFIALDEELDKFDKLAVEVANMSMTISDMVTKMSSNIYETCDNMQNTAMKVEEEVVRKAHALSVRSILASECVGNAMIKEATDKMYNKVLESIKCLHKEANRHSDIEVSITTRFNHHHRHMTQGKQAMKKCFVTNDVTAQRNCLYVISEEMKQLIDGTLDDLNTIHSQTLILWNLYEKRTGDCEKLAELFIVKLRDKLYLMEGCEGFSDSN